MRTTTPLVLVLTLLATGAGAQVGLGGKPMGGPPGLPQGVGTQDMWPAPKGEDWEKPVLIQFERTWDDAFAVSRETRKPILVCVNMDGEPASEHYAGILYRTPDVAKLFEPYVCVIASVYRHTPRDHDEEGRRVACPRFGSVTCGEHIAIEPGLFDKYMEDRRIAPRHIMLELDGVEQYDVFYAWDVKTILDTVRDGIAQRKIVAREIVRDDRPILERVESASLADREALEAAYASGDRSQRRLLLDAVLAHPAVEQTDLLRLAIFGPDADLASVARRALANSTSERSVDLIGESLRARMDDAEREALVAALERLGATSARARSLAAVHRGLSKESSTIDLARWSAALDRSGTEPAAKRAAGYELESRLAAQDRLAATRPNDAAPRIEFAGAALALARSADARTAPRYARVLLEDARRAALEAESLGAKGWAVDSTLALAAARAGDRAEAARRAEAAVRDLPPNAEDADAFEVVSLFVEARQDAISASVRAKREWPSSWIADLHAAYSVLARHPLATDARVVLHYDYLRWLGASGPAASVLEDGLARFPDSALLHDRLRSQILADRGAGGLEPAYQARLLDPHAPPTLAWYAGYASLVAAEFQRRSKKPDAALAAYARGVDHYERALALDPTERVTVDHFVALALAGRARVHLDRGDVEDALRELQASFARRPDSARSLDGLNVSPVDTARILLARLVRDGRCDLADALEASLAALDPRLLRPQDYEFETRPAGARGEGRARRAPPGSGPR